LPGPSWLEIPFVSFVVLLENIARDDLRGNEATTKNTKNTNEVGKDHVLKNQKKPSKLNNHLVYGHFSGGKDSARDFQIDRVVPRRQRIEMHQEQPVDARRFRHLGDG